MAVLTLTEGTHRIKWTMSNYDDLIAEIRVSSYGAVTCIKVTNGACGGNNIPRVVVSGTTVTGFMKAGTSKPTCAQLNSSYGSLARSYDANNNNRIDTTEYQKAYSDESKNIISQTELNAIKEFWSQNCTITVSGPTPTRTPTPTPGKQYIVNQARNFVSYNPPMITVRSDHPEGNYYIHNPSGYDKGGYVKYQFNVPTAGRYKLVGLVLADNYSHNSFKIKIDNQSTDIWDIKPKTEWQWVNISKRGNGNESNPQYPIYYSNIGVGTHDVYIYDREEQTKLRKLILTNDLDYMPDGKPIPTPTPTPVPSNSYENWKNKKGNLKNNLPALLEIIDGYMKWKSLGFTVTLRNLLNTVDGYLGF